MILALNGNAAINLKIKMANQLGQYFGCQRLFNDVGFAESGEVDVKVTTYFKCV